MDARSLGLLTSLYFLPFALFQLPLGVLLDRFGPREVQAWLMALAALGAARFAAAQGLAGLKALNAAVPKARLPWVNGRLALARAP